MIKCELCGKEFKQISNSHLKKQHNISLQEYQKQFPNSEIVSDEIKNKIKNKHSGKTKSKEHKEKISNSIKKGFENGRVVHNKGKKGHWKDSPETLEKKRQARTGKKHDEKTKKKIGDAHRGKTISQESIEKFKKSLNESIRKNGGGFATGPRSEEFKEKMSEIAKNRDQELINQKVEQMKEARSGQIESDEVREKKRVARLKWMEENPDKIDNVLFNTRPEIEFENILQEMKLNYKKQIHTRNPHYIFDFLIDNNFIIEIDGPYHYDPKLHGNDMKSFNKRLETDAIKNLTAGQKGYHIFRIKVGSNLAENWKEQLESQGLRIKPEKFALK